MKDQQEEQLCRGCGVVRPVCCGSGSVDDSWLANYCATCCPNRNSHARPTPTDPAASHSGQAERPPNGWTGIHRAVWNLLLDEGLVIGEADRIVVALSPALSAPCGACAEKDARIEKLEGEREKGAWSELSHDEKLEAAEAALSKKDLEIEVAKSLVTLASDRADFEARGREAAESALSALREDLTTLVESAEAYRLYSTELGGIERETALLHARNAARAALALPVLREEHERLKASEECAWTEDDDGNWNTGCGHMFTFNDDGPVENHQKFCGYCGGRLTAVPYMEPAE